MKVICKGDFPVYLVNQIQHIFKTEYIPTPVGFRFTFDNKPLDFLFDKDFSDNSLVPTLEDVYIGDGQNLLENKYANIAKISISTNGYNSYYDMSWKINNGGDLFRIIVLIYARLYGDSDYEFVRKLYDLCEDTLRMNSRFFVKFDEKKYKSFKTAYLFFQDYLDSFIEY